ncbi:MAG: MptD family putative ECF transporter S component [Lachnospiraceae bacterium]
MTYQKSASQKGLTVKDLVTTGIFAAILFVTILIGGIPFAPNPLLTFYMPLGSALLGGPVFLLLVAKVPKRGPITIVGILAGVVFFATGMHWAMDLGYILCGILGDIIAGSKKYRSVKMNIVAYICLCLGSTGTYIAFFVNPAAWSSLMLNGGTAQSYLDTMNSAAQGWMLPVILLGTAAVAAISGFAGSKLLKKQFEKAGITA